MLLHSSCEAGHFAVLFFVMNIVIAMVRSEQRTSSAGEFGWGGTSVKL